jgi:hypothetical protein
MVGQVVYGSAMNSYANRLFRQPDGTSASRRLGFIVLLILSQIIGGMVLRYLVGAEDPWGLTLYATFSRAIFGEMSTGVIYCAFNSGWLVYGMR